MSKKEKESSFKKFTELERLVLKKLIKKLEQEDYYTILATENELNYQFPKDMVTMTKRNGETLSSLDTQTLVYLITSKEASIELRANGVLVLFHKLNTSDDYPLANIITKEEYIKEAVIPSIKTVLTAIEFKLEIEEDETYKNIRGNAQSTNVAKTEVEKKEYGRSDKLFNEQPKKPNIDFGIKPRTLDRLKER